MDVVRATFKPEFLNRLDDLIMFDALSTEDLTRIVDLQVDKLAKRESDPDGRPAEGQVGQAPGGAAPGLGGHPGCPRMVGVGRVRAELRCPPTASPGAVRHRGSACPGAVVR